MPKKGFFRICSFFQKYPYKLNDRTFFETKARQGASLRKLELLLESYGLKAKKDLINKHLKECLGFETERKIERDAKKSRGLKSVSRRLGKFSGFIKLKEEPIPQKYPHNQTIHFFDLSSERIYVKCKSYGEILNRNMDPHRKQRRDRRNLVIYRSLRKR